MSHATIATILSCLALWSSQAVPGAGPLTLGQVVGSQLFSFVAEGFAVGALQLPKPKKPTYIPLGEDQARMIADHVSRLYERRETNRLAWISAITLVHGAVLSLVWWSMRNLRTTSDGHFVISIAFGALAVVSLSGAASMAAHTWSCAEGLTFLTMRGKGVPIADFCRRVYSNPFSAGVGIVAIALALAALWWTNLAVNNWNIATRLAGG